MKESPRKSWTIDIIDLDKAHYTKMLKPTTLSKTSHQFSQLHYEELLQLGIKQAIGEAINGNQLYFTSPSTRPKRKSRDNDGDKMVVKTRLTKGNNQLDVTSPRIARSEDTQGHTQGLPISKLEALNTTM